MIVTAELKDSLRKSLLHVSQFRNLQNQFNDVKHELATLGSRLSAYGNSAPPNSRLYRDIWALKNEVLGHRRAMKTIIIEMNNAYREIDRRGYVAATRPIFSMPEGETIFRHSPEFEALMVVTGYDAQWQRVNGMWDKAMSFSQEVDYLGNCCA